MNGPDEVGPRGRRREPGVCRVSSGSGRVRRRGVLGEYQKRFESRATFTVVGVVPGAPGYPRQGTMERLQWKMVRGGE